MRLIEAAAGRLMPVRAKASGGPAPLMSPARFHLPVVTGSSLTSLRRPPTVLGQHRQWRGCLPRQHRCRIGLVGGAAERSQGGGTERREAFGDGGHERSGSSRWLDLAHTAERTRALKASPTQSVSPVARNAMQN